MVLYLDLSQKWEITNEFLLYFRFSGVSAFNFYAVPIFQQSFGGTLLNPHLAAVITGTVQLIASALTGLLSDLIGRLPLLLLTSLLMSTALAGFGFYSYYRDSITYYLGSTASDWIPLICVLIFVASFSLGPNPISWLLVGEMFPLEYRGLGSSLTTAFSYVCAFVGVKTFIDLQVSFRFRLEHFEGFFWQCKDRRVYCEEEHNLLSKEIRRGLRLIHLHFHNLLPINIEFFLWVVPYLRIQGVCKYNCNFESISFTMDRSLFDPGRLLHL